jgi:phosphate-selective porin OprO and OprP
MQFKTKTIWLASTMLFASPLWAQGAPDSEAAPAEAAAPVSDAAAQNEFLQAQIEALQGQIDALKKQMPTAQPSWRGAPQWQDKDAGWTFKPRGRLQYDTAWISRPDNLDRVDSSSNAAARGVGGNLGFSSRVRRLRLGAEGAMPGGFGYKIDVDFANSSVGFGDAFLTWEKGPILFTIGNQESLNGLEQITSSNNISFLERSQMNEAFINTRRLGGSITYADPTGALRLSGGLFTGHSIDSSLDNDGWIAASRVTYSPQLAGGQLHLGANYQHRNFQANNGAVASTSAGAPSINQVARYRARPFLQTTGIRFVDSGDIAAHGDDIIGLELAGVFKAFHFASEAQWAKVDAYDANDDASSIAAFVNNFDPLGGTALSQARYLIPDDPTFFSVYGEVGFYLTGETRGYRNGVWNRTKVLKPVKDGGIGAIQLNARIDYLDLDTNKLKVSQRKNFTTGAVETNTNLTRGGQQTGYQLGLIWTPMDYVRFIAQYIHTNVQGGPYAQSVRPNSAKPVDERSYGVDSFAVRAQFDF